MQQPPQFAGSALSNERLRASIVSATASARLHLPFNLESGELIPENWAQCLKHDAVLLVARHARALRSLRGIYIDCGWRDQFHIHYGTRILSRRLSEARIPHRYEEFDDDHSDVDYRMDVSLPFLARALSA